MSDDTPAVSIPAMIATVKFNQSDDGGATIVLKVPSAFGPQAAAMCLLIGNFCERVEFYAPSKMEHA